MTQAASIQNNTAMQLLGLIAGSGFTSESGTQGLKLGQNGGLSFQALLMINPEQLANGQQITNTALQNKSQSQLAQATQGGMPSLLKLQAVNADGAAENLMSLGERLAHNIETMLAQQSNGEGSANGLTAANINGGEISADLLFMFNAPFNPNSKSMILSNISSLNSNENVQNGNFIKQLQDGTLSADTVFALMMQQGGENANKTPEEMLNTLFSDTLNAENKAIDQQQLQQMQDDFYAGLTGFLMIFEGGPNAQQFAAGQNTIMKPFTGNFQAGQNPSASTGKDSSATGDFKSAIVSLTGPNAADKSATTDANAMNTKGSEDGTSIKSALQGSINSLTGQNANNGIKPLLMNSSALTPAQMQNYSGITSAGQASSTLSFANVFGDGDISDQLAEMPEIQHGMIKADLQDVANKANPLVAAKQAGAPHPATQSVMQQINLMASRNARGDSEMRMKLDPPELGNLIVSLKFGKNNTVKAHLSVERPETLAMLQKDSASLQKALEDAGLDVSQDSLSFNLQGQGSGDAFGSDQNNQNNFGKFGQNGNGYNGANGEEDPNRIDTQMTVFIDPHTGQQRVNMMV